MTTLEVFDFRGGKVRTAGTMDRPLFCAADVCSVLDITNVGNALARLGDSDIENIRSVDAQGKNRPIAFITEAGLYKLIMRSRKPDAEPFVEWVTGEVLPAIRRKGYYSALEAELEKQTELLLVECFPNLPGKAEPIFRGLISALVKLRKEHETGNPPWARLLARMIYAWAIPIEGEQAKRRELNAEPSATSVDYSMLSERAKEAVLQTITTATAFARISTTWEDWKVKMEIAFGKKAIQLPFLVPMASLPSKGAA